MGSGDAASVRGKAVKPQSGIPLLDPPIFAGDFPSFGEPTSIDGVTRRDLPTGTVTFLFSDIEGSTPS
jgi:hypothetical protein